MGGTLHFEGGQIGAIFATMGIASLIMPGLTRYHRRQMDKRRTPLWHTPPHRCRCSDLCFNCHHIQPHVLGHAAQHACLHAYTISGQHRILQCIGKYKMDLIKDFPPIRVWGTIGFICAMWAVDLTGFKNSSAQLYVGGASALLLGLYSFTLPACRPAKSENKSWLSAFGLDALVLFKKKKMAIFFLFSMLFRCSIADYKYLW